MKKILVLVLILWGASFAQAQQANNETFFFDSLYIGSLHTVQFQKSWQYNNSSGYQFGAMKIFSLPLSTQLTVAGTYDQASSTTTNLIKLQIPIIKFLKIEAGLFDRPITLHRPNFPGAGRHFEPPALKIIPGNTLGARSITHIYPGHDIMLGLYQGDSLEIEFNAAYRITNLQGWNMAISAYHNLKNNHGLAMSIKSDWLLTNFFHSNEWTSFLLCLNLANNWQPYLSAKFDKDNRNQDLDDLEIGLTRTFSKKSKKSEVKLNFLIGPSYVFLPEPRLNIYFQFWIDI